MKPLSLEEIDGILRDLQSFRQAQLQDVWVTDRLVALKMWIPQQGEYWLVLGIDKATPIICYLLPEEMPVVRKPPVKPMALFLRAHAVGRRLLSVTRVITMGRVVQLKFGREGDGSNCVLEFRLIPRAVNLIASTPQARLSLRPVLPLTGDGGGAPRSSVEPSPRSPADVKKEWLNSSSVREKAPRVADRHPLDPSKIAKTMAKVQAELERQRALPWKDVGHWVVSHQKLEVPEEWASYIDQTQSLAWNIQNCFFQAGRIEKKIRGHERRLAELSVQTQAGGGGSSLAEEVKTVGTTAQSPLMAAGARGRTRELPGGWTAYFGKSAKDNLALLRRAQPWDYWLHVRDLPGSHGFVRRARNSVVPDDILRQAAEWLLMEQFGGRRAIHEGEKFDVVVTECRYVRPISGDRLGQVTYQKARVLRVALGTAVRSGRQS